MSSVLSAYRNALRATKVAFRQDLPILQAARVQLKQGIRDNSNLQAQPEIEEAVQKLNEVAKFLIQNIVQGEKQQDGKYFLNFHEKRSWVTMKPSNKDEKRWGVWQVKRKFH